MWLNPCKCCGISNRTGAAIAGLINTALYAICIWLNLFPHESIENIFVYSDLQAKGIIIYLAIGIILSLLVVLGVMRKNIYLCLPGTIFLGCSVILAIVGLVYFSHSGSPIRNSEKAFIPIIVAFIFISFHIFHLWILTAYICELNALQRGTYEQFSYGSATSSRAASRDRHKTRSPVFKLRSGFSDHK